MLLYLNVYLFPSPLSKLPSHFQCLFIPYYPLAQQPPLFINRGPYFRVSQHSKDNHGHTSPWHRLTTDSWCKISVPFLHTLLVFVIGEGNDNSGAQSPWMLQYHVEVRDRKAWVEIKCSDLQLKIWSPASRLCVSPEDPLELEENIKYSIIIDMCLATLKEMTL